MTMPDELRRSTPRPVSLNPIGKVAMLSFVLLVASFIAEIAWVSANSGAGGGGLPKAVGSAGVCLLIALAMSLWKVPRQMHLLACGRWTVARTTGKFRRVGPTGLRRYRVKCEFTTLSGGRMEATVESRSALPAGTEISIVYDPDEPKKAMLYPARLVGIES